MGNNSAIHFRRAFILLGVLTLAFVGSRDLSADDEEGGEWKTMHSERSYRRRPSHHASKSWADSSSIKLDEQKQKITTPKISFDSNGVEPTAASQRILKQLASFLEKKPEIVIRIEGHSDSVGSDQSNLDISQKRADRAKEILVAAGVAVERLEAVGMGDKSPIASDTTPAGQEKNRRIEFSVMGSMAPAAAPTEPVAPVAPIAPGAPVMPMPAPAPTAPIYPPSTPTTPGYPTAPAYPTSPTMPTAPVAPSYPATPGYPTAPAYPTTPAPVAPSYPTTPAYPSAPSPYPMPQPAPSPVPPTSITPSYPAAPVYPAPVSPAPSTIPPVPTPVR